MFVPVKDTTGRESRHAPRRDDADTGQHSGHHGECHEAMNTAAGWERYARERPEFAVLTDGTTGSAFFASGERAVEERLHVVRALGYTVGPRALDLGCGMGRLSLALALHFQEVIGVDHSRTMIGLARTRAIEAQVSNARFFESDGGGLGFLADECIDFAISLLVFQHMPTWQLVSSNVTGVARTLVPGGMAWFHFDTRPPTLLYRAWNAVEPHLPAWVGPETRRAPLRRYRRAAVALDQLFEQACLAVLSQRHRCTDVHEYLLRRVTR